MNSTAAEPRISKRLRVAVHIADPLRRKRLIDALLRTDFMLADVAADADVVLSDEQELPLLTVPSVVVGERANAAGLVAPNASLEQIEAAIRAVAAGLVVRPQEPDRREFRAQTEFDEDVLLTARELQVLDAIAAGLTNKGIARQLGISLHTVKFHVESLFRKLDARTRTEAVAKALERRRIEMISV